MNSSPSSLTRIRYARPDFDACELHAVREALVSGMVGPGARTDEFEKQAARYLNLADVLATNSGSAALLLAIRDLNLPRGSCIGVPAYTYVGTANAVYEAGHWPIPIDIDLDTLCVSYKTIRYALAQNSGIRALVLVHLGGYIIPLEEYETFGLPVIHDAAHAFHPGAFNHTDRVCFSFGAIKNLSCGAGGAYAGNVSDTARHHAQNGRWPHAIGIGGGFNFRMPDLNAAIGCAQLLSIQSRDRRRVSIVERYCDAGLPMLQFPTAHPHLAIVWAKNNYQMRSDFLARGIETQIHYTPRENAWLDIALIEHALPNTFSASNHCLSLPLHSKLSDIDVQTVIDTYEELA